MEAGDAVGAGDHGGEVSEGGVEGGEAVVDAAIAEGEAFGAHDGGVVMVVVVTVVMVLRYWGGLKYRTRGDGHDVVTDRDLCSVVTLLCRESQRFISLRRGNGRPNLNTYLVYTLDRHLTSAGCNYSWQLSAELVASKTWSVHCRNIKYPRQPLQVKMRRKEGQESGAFEPETAVSGPRPRESSLYES